MSHVTQVGNMSQIPIPVGPSRTPIGNFSDWIQSDPIGKTGSGRI